MDQHHYLHHHQHQQHRSRYAPVAPQSNHHLPPPPPPPAAPPPPPLSYRSMHTPPPPPYNPPPPQQFLFNPPNYPQEERPISSNHHHGFSNRTIPDDILPRRSHPDFDRRNPEPLWNPSPRAVPEDRPQRNYPPVDLDREPHHHHHHYHQNHRPTPPPSYPPIDNLRYDPDRARQRIERLDAYEGNPREGFSYRGGGDSNYHRRASSSHLDAPTAVQASSMQGDVGVDTKSGGYVRVYGVESESDVSTRGGRGESRRWVNDRKVHRDLHDSSFELVNNEMGKREYYGSDIARHNSRGNNREFSHEFPRTPPKKQIQKKSALLRIQTVKPNYRNREIEQLRYSTYAPDSNPNFFRGKEQHGHGYSGHGMKAEEREGSPVELDISFESNSLVAKAIVAPSSSAHVSDSNGALVSDSDLTCVERSKKVLVSESDCSGLQPDKVSSATLDLNSLPGNANDVSSSDKDFSLQKNVPDGSSQPSASVANNPIGKVEVPHSVEVTKTCSGKSSTKVVKKKKVVKRVAKKAVVNPKSAMSNSLSANKHSGTQHKGSVTLISSTVSGPDKAETDMEEKSTVIDKVPLPDCLQSSPNKGNVLAEDKMAGLSLQTLAEDKMAGLSLQTLEPDSRSQKCKTDEDSGRGGVSRFKSGGNISNSPSCASSSEDKKNDCDCLDANNSAYDLLRRPNAGEVTTSLNESTSSETNLMDYDHKLSCQNEVSLSSGKFSNVGCSQNRNLVDLRDEMNDKLFSSAEHIISTNLISTHNAANDRVYGFNLNDFAGSEEKVVGTDTGNNCTVDKDYGENTNPTITRYVILEESTDTGTPLQSCEIFSFSGSEKTRTQDGLDCLQPVSVVKQGPDDGSSNLEDSIAIHGCVIMNDARKQVSSGDITVSPENCDREITFSNSKISVGTCEGDRNKINKRKVRTHSKLLSSKMESRSPDSKNPDNHANKVDSGTSVFMKDPCLSEVLDQPAQCFDINSQYGLDEEVTASHGKEARFFVGHSDNDEANEVSPDSKRKKVTARDPTFSQCQAEFGDAIVATTSSADVPISSSDKQAYQKEDAVSSVGILSTDQSMPYSEDICKLSENMLAGGSFESNDANRETMSSEDLELEHVDIVSDSVCEDLAFTNDISMLESGHKENISPIVPTSDNQTEILVIGSIKGEKTDLQAVEENYQYKHLVQSSPRADMESNDLNIKDDLVAQQNLISCPADGDRLTTSSSNDELIEDALDAFSGRCSPGMMSEVPDRRILEFTAAHDESICGNEENMDNISVVDLGSDSHTFISSIQHTNEFMKPDHAIGCSNQILSKITSEPTRVHSKVTVQGPNSYCSEVSGAKNQPGGIIHKAFRAQSFTFSKSKRSTSSTHISKPRTWHRTGNNPPASLPSVKPSVGTVPPKRPILERKGNFQNTSYVRKGNTLVRKRTPVSALPLVSTSNQSLGFDEIPKSIRIGNRVDVTDQPINLNTGVANTPQQRQRTPPLPIDTKSEENISSLLVEPAVSGCCENASELRKFVGTNDAPNSSEDVLKHHEIHENQTGVSDNGESQVEANNGNIPFNTKRIVYIKPKTNQLVATSNSCDASVSTDDKGQTAFSDCYYKRSKNQLVRSTFESHVNQTIAMPNKTVNSDEQGASKVLRNRRFSKKRSLKVARNLCKPSRASLVWTLRSKGSAENDRNSWHYQKVLPHLFPWKRATFLRSFIHNSSAGFNSSSLSSISKKLLLLRKRDTLYTRSTHGFSLRKSKVLGVGGSSLKWSKSIEKHSKQANEEATLAVAAVERKKREQQNAVCIRSQAKRERIFRIGSVRYRMDPSRRTLQRISDDESLSTASTCSASTAKRSYIPRRLVIGNDEYVRIGNGNQLIRDPKKRTRKLANEKVRWSLHTARQRLARKQKYCQFFTRFGKCNKDGGKCPYIHDPSKIAVCTKFLNGLCSTPNCKLTHKVIPERMPDCSYFLQGLCSNQNCPYRHVNVNPKASICEGFLKGYCADGNECRKKHSYVCPTFEATGTCTQGTKCKLHHPKKQSRGKKRKRSGDQNSSRGRYFGSLPVDVSEPGKIVALRQHQQKDELEGELSDYISLDLNEEFEDTVDQSFEEATLCDNNSLDLQLDSFDEHIKPVLILKPNFTSRPCSEVACKLRQVMEIEGSL